MTSADLLLELDRLGVRLEADGERLRYFPRSALTPDLIARLKANKVELLAKLRPARQLDSIDPDNAASVWRAALAALEVDRRLPPDLLNALRAVDAQWLGDATMDMPTPQSDASTKVVCQCGGTTWRDVPIHGGRSIRRDCGRCDRFLEFVVWYGDDALRNEQH